MISDLQRTPDSMVVHAYILLDPDKDNLYHSYTVWFSSEGFVRFGKWILFPANVHVERALVVPDRYTYGSILCSTTKTKSKYTSTQILEIFVRQKLHSSHGIRHL